MAKDRKLVPLALSRDQIHELQAMYMAAKNATLFKVLVANICCSEVMPLWGRKTWDQFQVIVSAHTLRDYSADFIKLFDPHGYGPDFKNPFWRLFYETWVDTMHDEKSPGFHKLTYQQKTALCWYYNELFEQLPGVAFRLTGPKEFDEVKNVISKG